MKRSSERGGLFWDYERGISRECPLSPLIGAFFLKQLDDRMERLGLFYVRFMDDMLASALPAGARENGPGILSIFLQANILSTITRLARDFWESPK